METPAWEKLLKVFSPRSSSAQLPFPACEVGQPRAPRPCTISCPSPAPTKQLSAIGSGQNSSVHVLLCFSVSCLRLASVWIKILLQ